MKGDKRSPSKVKCLRIALTATWKQTLNISRSLQTAPAAARTWKTTEAFWSRKNKILSVPELLLCSSPTPTVEWWKVQTHLSPRASFSSNCSPRFCFLAWDRKRIVIRSCSMQVVQLTCSVVARALEHVSKCICITHERLRAAHVIVTLEFFIGVTQLDKIAPPGSCSLHKRLVLEHSTVMTSLFCK